MRTSEESELAWLFRPIPADEIGSDVIAMRVSTANLIYVDENAWAKRDNTFVSKLLNMKGAIWFRPLPNKQEAA